MKLEKLLTLSQFIKSIGYGGKLGATKTLAAIHKYNDFLKQPLKREMFVNELEIPINMYYIPDHGVQKYPQECYLPDLEAFKQALKKLSKLNRN